MKTRAAGVGQVGMGYLESDIPGVLLESPPRKALICLTTETTSSQHVALAFQLSAGAVASMSSTHQRGRHVMSRPMVLALSLPQTSEPPSLHTDLLVPFSTLLSSPLAPVSKGPVLCLGLCLLLPCQLCLPDNCLQNAFPYIVLGYSWPKRTYAPG